MNWVGGCLKTPTNNLPPTVSSHSSCVSTGHQDSYREWRYHMLLVYNYVLLNMSTWCSKHVEESNILRINNSQCIKLVIIGTVFMHKGGWYKNNCSLVLSSESRTKSEYKCGWYIHWKCNKLQVRYLAMRVPIQNSVNNSCKSNKCTIL